MKDGYKVFSVIAGRMYPFFHNMCFQAYSKTEINTRADECGPFSYFDAYENAKKFCDKYQSGAFKSSIWKIEVRKSKSKKFWMPWEVSNLRNNGCTINNIHGRRERWQYLPSGTMFADEFKMVYKVF